jgi:hypothetical protein
MEILYVFLASHIPFPLRIMWQQWQFYKKRNDNFQSVSGRIGKKLSPKQKIMNILSSRDFKAEMIQNQSRSHEEEHHQPCCNSYRLWWQLITIICKQHMDHEDICKNLITKRFVRSPDHEEICEKLKHTIQCRHPINL